MEFLRCNVNSDEVVDMRDAVYILNYLYLGSEAPPCLDAADINDDGEINITDPIYPNHVIIDVEFKDGASYLIDPTAKTFFTYNKLVGWKI